MAFNVNQFKQALRGEGARPTLFDAFISFPPAAAAGAALVDFTFMCKAAQLPGQQLGVIEVPYYGRKIKVPGDRIFIEWTITVINDENFTVKDAFTRWSNAINSHVGNLRSPQNFYADARIVQYGKEGDILKTYKFVDMWPSDIAPIDVSWEANDTIEEFTVTLNYNWFEDAGNTDQA